MYTYDEIDQRVVDQRVAQFRDQTERFLAGKLGEDEFRQIGRWIVEVVDGLAANGEEGNGAVEAAVKAKVEALCHAFPIYPGL